MSLDFHSFDKGCDRSNHFLTSERLSSLQGKYVAQFGCEAVPAVENTILTDKWSKKEALFRLYQSEKKKC